MRTDATRGSDAVIGERLRLLARRCRELSETAAVPEVTQELASIAGELESEAARTGSENRPSRA